MAVKHRLARSAFSALLALVATITMGCPSRDKVTAQGPYAREVSEAIPRIEKVTGLKFKKQPVLERRTKEQVHAFLVKQFEDERSQADLNAQQILLRRLGLVSEDFDLRALMLDLYTEQIVGFYDPETKVLYVIDGAKPEEVGFVVEHELVHALQDQYTNLDSLLHIKGDDDRVLAAQSVMEGQATLVPIQSMLGPAAGLPGGWEKVRQLIRENQGSMPKFAAAPQILQETLLFPYLSGAEFMRRYQDQGRAGMPFGPNMPVSSTQIMHADAYFGGHPEKPVSITLPAPQGATSTYQNDMGEFETRVFLFQHLKDQNASVLAADGWSGDRYMILHSPHGDGIAWVTAWRSAVDAGEFRTAMQKVFTARFPKVQATEGAQGTHLVANKRSMVLTGGDVNGHSVVVYVDVPEGDRTDVLDLSKMEIK
ncbi:MAG: hypothetical protein JWO39_2182 [Gemmatimonadetes bacterium]|nr:hypothetical protein [Gemmatimonadota bacterium]